MIDLPSRKDLAALMEAANAVVPSAVLGFVRTVDADRMAIIYTYRHGMGEFVLAGPDVPDALRPSHRGSRQADATAGSNPGGVVERFLEIHGIQRVASFAVPGLKAPTRIWIGLTHSTPLTSNQLNDLEQVAEASATLLAAPVSSADEADRQRRLELTAGLLPALLHVLDVRDVFDRLSRTAQAVLPHDLLLLILFADDLSRFTIFARSGEGAEFGPELPNQYPAAAVRAWEFDIVDDHTTHPMELNTPATRMGARSSVRVPIRFDERVIGGVGFISFERARYSGADVAVARRLADYVAVALSHYQLAEENRRAATLQERAANLDLLDGLMSTITNVLDVREVFDRIFEISQRALPHDAMSIAIPSQDGKRVTLYARTGALRHLPVPLELPLGDPSLLDGAWEFVLKADCREDPQYATILSVQAGMRSLIIIPVRLEEQLRAWVNFWSATPGRFTTADVPVARRIAAHVTLTLSHQRLAEQARLTEELRARTTNLELLDELLVTISDSDELSEVFDRISAVAGKVLPHDGLCLVVVLTDGERARRYVNAGYDVGQASAIVPVIEAFKTPDIDHEIVDDLALSNEPHNVIPYGFGFRSALRVPIWLDGRLAADLSFLSRCPSTYATRDVLVARRITDRIALCLRRERGLEAAMRADEASSRAVQLEMRVRQLTEELDARTGYRRVVGASASWKHVLTQATQVAASDTTVLLLGESGTGKEVVARFLHRASPRSKGPFIALNCAALPEQLLEAELFGYERGAYTGATQSKPGQLEQAAGGTLLLDEVSEMSPSAQAKFLRVLQEREFQRLGGTRVLRTDARVVAATNRDLQRAIAHGQFREDLYYRLNVFAIRLPALRDRKSDILPLSEAFLTEIGRGLGRPPGGISREARQLLVEYHWPGNVRELRNILERAAILCDGGLITAEHLAISPPSIAASPPPIAEFSAVTAVPAVSGRSMSAGDLQTMERAMIEQALQDARFNKSKAAKTLGLTRHQLYIRMRKYGFE